MASLISDLQELLTAERGQVEAVRVFEEEMEELDPDIVRGLRDVESSSTWICQGLYHRINQLGATPTLAIGDLRTRLLSKAGLEDQLHVLCSEQTKLIHKLNDILKNDEPDQPTRELLEESNRLHHQAKDWCNSVLGQWKREAASPS